MAEPRRGLGRGLSALLEEAQAAVTPEARRDAGVVELPIESIRPNPGQPRKRFEQAALTELADSIRARGVLQPIIVRPRPDGGAGYDLIAGERRWRAAQMAGLERIPALVRALSDLEVMEVALIENLQRSDLGPLEEARAYEALASHFSKSADEIAKAVGKSRSHVANTLRLLRASEGVLGLLEDGRISAGHARALLEAPHADRLAEQVVEKGLSVRQTEELARRGRSGRRLETPQAKDADTRVLESDLSDALGMSVTIRDSGGSGEVVIAYRDLDQLDEIARRLIGGRFKAG